MNYAPRLRLWPPAYWQDFEYLCWSLWKVIWNDDKAQLHGRSGQQQHGIDVFGRKEGKLCGIQCKGRDSDLNSHLTEKEIYAEVEKAKSFSGLREFIIATTAPRDALAQAVAQKITDSHLREGLFSVHVYAWHDIEDLILCHRPENICRQYCRDAMDDKAQETNFFFQARFLAVRHRRSPGIFEAAAAREGYTAPGLPSVTGMERWHDLLQFMHRRGRPVLPELMEYDPDAERVFEWTRPQLRERLAEVPIPHSLVFSLEADTAADDAQEMLRLWAVKKSFSPGKNPPLWTPLMDQLKSALTSKGHLLEKIMEEGSWINQKGDFVDRTFASALAADTLLEWAEVSKQDAGSHFHYFIDDLANLSPAETTVFRFWLEWTHPQWQTWIETWLEKRTEHPPGEIGAEVLPHLVALDRVLFDLDADRAWHELFPFSISYCRKTGNSKWVAHCLVAMGESRVAKYGAWFHTLLRENEGDALKVARIIRVLLEARPNLSPGLQPQWLRLITAALPGAAVDQIRQACTTVREFQRWLQLLPLTLFPEAEAFLHDAVARKIFPDPGGKLTASIASRLARGAERPAAG